MQRTELPGEAAQEDNVAECCHYWVIESPNGPTSYGQCKWCGTIREFKNSVHVTSWESDGNHLHRGRGVHASRGMHTSRRV